MDVNGSKSGRLSGFHMELESVVRALKIINPKLGHHVNGTLGNLEVPLKQVTAFLITQRGRHFKPILAMGLDYFNLIQEPFEKFGSGFRSMHIFSPRTCKLFTKHLSIVGSMYWDDRGDNEERGDVRVGDGVVICAGKEGREVNLKEMKDKLRQKYARR